MSIESYSLETCHLSITSRILDCNHRHLHDDGYILVPVVLYGIFGYFDCPLGFARQLFKIQIFLSCMSIKQWFIGQLLPGYLDPAIL